MLFLFNADIIDLLLRWAVALAMLPFGIKKIMDWSDRKNFPTVFGMPPAVAYTMTLLIETIVPIFLMAGLFTRIVAIPAIITYIVATKVSIGKCYTSPAWLYLFTLIIVFLAGPGKYSLDALIY